MTITEFTEQLNSWGRDKVPFLFMVDFEMETPFACRLGEATGNQIYYDIRGVTNIMYTGKEILPVLKKHPESKEHYEEKFNFVSRHLHYGDSFLTNLTIRTEVELSHSMREIFLASRAKYRLMLEERFLVFSPETFVRIAGEKITAYPMKGTMDSSIENAAEILLGNKKEAAEHVTIVDLIRNDLGQIASNVTVNRFRYLEEVKTSNKNLFQMSSEISGDVLPEYKDRLGDLLIKLLPAGSVSGAPKSKTLEIIRSAEKENRGFYTGVFGYFNGSEVDSGVMIRCIEKVNGKFYYRSGGGITTQSNANSEYEEAIDKIYVPID